LGLRVGRVCIRHLLLSGKRERMDFDEQANQQHRCLSSFMTRLGELNCSALLEHGKPPFTTPISACTAQWRGALGGGLCLAAHHQRGRRCILQPRYRQLLLSRKEMRATETAHRSWRDVDVTSTGLLYTPAIPITLKHYASVVFFPFLWYLNRLPELTLF